MVKLPTSDRLQSRAPQSTMALQNVPISQEYDALQSVSQSLGRIGQQANRVAQEEQRVAQRAEQEQQRRQEKRDIEIKKLEIARGKSYIDIEADKTLGALGQDNDYNALPEKYNANFKVIQDNVFKDPNIKNDPIARGYLELHAQKKHAEGINKAKEMQIKGQNDTASTYVFERSDALVDSYINAETPEQRDKIIGEHADLQASLLGMGAKSALDAAQDHRKFKEKSESAWHEFKADTDPEAYIQEFSPKKKIYDTQDLKGLSGSKYSDLIVQKSQEHGIDPLLAFAVKMQENSMDDPAIKSSAGAVGLMQLMPSTAKELGVENISDPEQNINGGVKYLKQMLDRYDGDTEKALAAYNAGMGNVDKYGGIPPFKETKNYVKKIMAHYEKLKGENKATSTRQSKEIRKNLDAANKKLDKKQDLREEEQVDLLSKAAINGDLDRETLTELLNEGRISLDVFSKASSQVGKNETLIAKAEKKRQDQLFEQKEAQTNQYFQMAASGNLNEDQLVNELTNGVIDHKQYKSLSKEVRRVQKEITESTKHQKMLLNGDASHPDYKKSVDYTYDNQILQAITNEETPEGKTKIAVSAINSMQDVVPTTLKKQLSSAYNSGNPSQGIFLAETINALDVFEDRTAISQLPDDLQNYANVYNNEVINGNAPQEAARIAHEYTHPDNQRVEMFTQKFNENLRDEKIGKYDLLEKYGDNSFFENVIDYIPFVDIDPAINAIDQTNEMYPQLAGEFSDLVQHNYIRNGGDMDNATEMAKEAMGKKWGGSIGNKLMKYPPEKMYGIKDRSIVEIDFYGSLAKELSIDKVDIENDNYSLTLNPQQEKSALRGEKPSYMVLKDGAPMYKKNASGGRELLVYKPDIEEMKNTETMKEELKKITDYNQQKDIIAMMARTHNLTVEQMAQRLLSSEQQKDFIRNIPQKSIDTFGQSTEKFINYIGMGGE